MAYQEVTTTGYGTRVGRSFKSIGTGFLLFIAATALLWWNEGNVFETTIQSQANRLSKEKNVTAEQLQTLTLDDVQWKN